MYSLSILPKNVFNVGYQNIYKQERIPVDAYSRMTYLVVSDGRVCLPPGQTPPPPPRMQTLLPVSRMTDRQVSEHNFRKLRLRAVIKFVSCVSVEFSVFLQKTAVLTTEILQN